MTGIATNQIAIRDIIGLTACVTIDQLDETLPDIQRREIIKSTGKLIFKGYVERVDRGCYQLTKEGQVSLLSDEVLTSGPFRPHTSISRKRRADTLRQRVWNVMRMSTSFTYEDLEIAASKQEKSVLNNIQKFMGALIKTGYVLQMPIRQSGTKLTSCGFKRFKLLNDTGPIVPTIRFPKKEVFDHNNQEVTSWK